MPGGQIRIPRLERGGQVEYGPSFLDGHDPAGGKTFAVADTVHIVDHGQGRIAGPEKIGVQAVGFSIRRHGLIGGRQGLAQHLAAENAAESQILALTAKDIFFDLLQFEQVQQFRQHLVFDANGHGNPPPGMLGSSGMNTAVPLCPDSMTSGKAGIATIILCALCALCGLRKKYYMSPNL